jgi:hypothetical protein
VCDLESAEAQAQLAPSESGDLLGNWNGWPIHSPCPEGTLLHAHPFLPTSPEDIAVTTVWPRTTTCEASTG